MSCPRESNSERGILPLPGISGDIQVPAAPQAAFAGHCQPSGAPLEIFLSVWDHGEGLVRGRGEAEWRDGREEWKKEVLKSDVLIRE